jgi:hypothetical protein
MVRIPLRFQRAVLDCKTWIARADGGTLKIEVEGVEDVILAPFFRDAAKSLWPRLLIIEDTSNLWQLDLLSETSALGYSVAARTKLNVLLRRLSSGTNR